jgi:hypothetical protein
VSAAEAANSLPIWSCSVWGLPCPRHYCRGGALLPHLFTLTPLPGRYVFCGTCRPSGLNLTSRTLSGTLLCGVRTFLSSRPKTREATVRSGCLQSDYNGIRRPNSAASGQIPLPAFFASGILPAVRLISPYSHPVCPGADSESRKPDPHEHCGSHPNRAAIVVGE